MAMSGFCQLPTPSQATCQTGSDRWVTARISNGGGRHFGGAQWSRPCECIDAADDKGS